MIGDREELTDVIYRLSLARGVGFDLDGVVADFVGSFLDFFNDSQRTSWEIEDVRSYHLERDFGVKRGVLEKEHERFIERGCYRHLEPYDKAIQLMHDLNARGVWTPIITFRDPRLADQTYEWLHLNGVDLRNGVYFHRDKAEMVKVLGLQGFVEDSAKNANEIATRALVNAYLLERPWNDSKEKHKDVIVVKDYTQLRKLLEGYR